MAIYTRRRTGLGYVVYARDKKPVKTIAVPANIVRLLETEKEVDDTGMKLEKPYGRCLFCLKLTHLEKTVQGQTIAICEEHFYSKTTGQIAQEINSKVKGTA